jgi:hypothetical protein
MRHPQNGVSFVARCAARAGHSSFQNGMRLPVRRVIPCSWVSKPMSTCAVDGDGKQMSKLGIWLLATKHSWKDSDTLYHVSKLKPAARSQCNDNERDKNDAQSKKRR